MNEQIVRNFVEARRARTAVPADPCPADQAEAYAVSAGIRAALSEAVGGWKVGHAPEGSKAPMGAPMYASGFLKSGGVFKFKPGRAMIPEIEIAVRLSRDLPPRPDKTYSRDEILEYCSELLLGIELIERRIPKGAAFALNLADDLGNIGYVVGPAIKVSRDLDLTKLRCQFWIGGALHTDRAGGHAKGDPLSPLVDWANAQRDRHGGMKAGHVVTLGSLTPMIEMLEPAPLRAALEDFGEVSLAMA